MPSRLLQVLVPAAGRERLDALLEDWERPPLWSQTVGDDVVATLLVPAERVQSVLDGLTAAYPGDGELRVAVLEVAATLPPAERPDDEPDEVGEVEEDAPDEDALPDRISREELRELVSDGISYGRVFLAMTALSTVVTAIGLHRSSPTILIGAMVIAPLLMPNVGLALATTLGDTPLFTRALRATLLGGATGLAASFALGLLLDLDPRLPEVAARVEVGWGDIVIALASGTAGALALASGWSTALVGVMVAVALMPPLVALGMLLADGDLSRAVNAATLLVTNVVAINLSAIATFLARGVRPRGWWAAQQSARSSRHALLIWVALLALVTAYVALVELGLVPRLAAP